MFGNKKLKLEIEKLKEELNTTTHKANAMCTCMLSLLGNINPDNVEGENVIFNTKNLLDTIDNKLIEYEFLKGDVKMLIEKHKRDYADKPDGKTVAETIEKHLNRAEEKNPTETIDKQTKESKQKRTRSNTKNEKQ